MKTMQIVTLGLMILSVGARAGLGQSAAVPVPVYVDENQKDPPPLKLGGLSGQVKGLGGDAMPRAVVSLFTEETHTLVASVNSDKDGKFKFDKVGKAERPSATEARRPYRPGEGPGRRRNAKGGGVAVHGRDAYPGRQREQRH